MMMPKNLDSSGIARTAPPNVVTEERGDKEARQRRVGQAHLTTTIRQTLHVDSYIDDSRFLVRRRREPKEH